MYFAQGLREDPPIVLGANNSKMLELAGRDTNGALTYLATPHHTAQARATVGTGKWLCAVQAVLLEKDPMKARTVAREYVSAYLGIPAYRKGLRPFGFADDDFAEGGSDHLIDSLVVWGGETELRARIDAHYKAGATHVSVLALDSAGGLLPSEAALDALALSV